LVDGLDIIEAHSIEDTCENCIFRKMYNLPYNEEVIHKTKVLKYIHVDLWGLSSVILAGGSHYFMLLMDETSSFQTVEFLTEKIVENILEVLKVFITEGERQIE